MMKILVLCFVLANFLFATDETTNEKIINLLNEVKHNKSHNMNKISQSWSGSLYKRKHDSRLDIDKNGNFKRYIPDKLKNYDGGLIGSRGKYWVYSSIKKTCLVWKGIVEKNGVQLNKHYPDICKSKNDSGLGAIVLETSISDRNLLKGFWSLSKFEFKKKNILTHTNFQGTRKWYIQVETPNQVQQERDFKDAVYKNDTAKMDEILKSNVNININKMFMLAMEVSDLKTVKFLVNNGADVNHKGRFGDAVTRASSKDSNIDKIEYVLASGFKFNKKLIGDNTPIHTAAQTRQIKLINFWVDKGVDINLERSNGKTPLFDACRNKKNIFAGISYYDTFKLLEYMISKGADPLHEDKQKRTALHVISKYGTVEQVKYISSFFKDINLQDKYKQTPLHYAVLNIQYDNKQIKYDVVKYLLSKGANKKIKNKMNQTAYDIVNKMSFPDKKILALLK